MEVDKPKMVVHNPRTEDSPYKNTELGENETAIRIIETNEKNYTIRCTDPHGFWKVHTKGGKIPKRLQGVFLTAFDAQRAISDYLSTLPVKGSVNKRHRESLGLE